MYRLQEITLYIAPYVRGKATHREKGDSSGETFEVFGKIQIITESFQMNLDRKYLADISIL